MAKTVVSRPDWLKAQSVQDVLSLSTCNSKDLLEAVSVWDKNQFELFNSIDELVAAAKKAGVALDGQKIFYYECHEQEFDVDSARWAPFGLRDREPPNIQRPTKMKLEGYDCVNSYLWPDGPFFECSPLSCNSLSENVRVNEHCLFPDFESAKVSLDHGDFKEAEPGPYRIIAVYSVPLN